MPENVLVSVTAGLLLRLASLVHDNNVALGVHSATTGPNAEKGICKSRLVSFQ